MAQRTTARSSGGARAQQMQIPRTAMLGFQRQLNQAVSQVVQRATPTLLKSLATRAQASGGGGTRAAASRSSTPSRSSTADRSAAARKAAQTRARKRQQAQQGSDG